MNPDQAPQVDKHTSLPGSNFSLRFLLFTGLCCIIAGMLLLGGGALYTMRKSAATSDMYVKVVLPEMHHTMALQILLSQAAMPPNDYLIHADPAERAKFRKLTEQVNQHLDHLESLPSLHIPQKKLVHYTRTLWEKAHDSGEELLNIHDPIGSNQASMAMKQFDNEINAAIMSLQTMHDYLADESSDYYSTVHELVEKSTLYIYGFSLAGLVAMLVGMILLTRKVIGSVTQLCAGVENYASGQFDHRVSTRMPTELSLVAQGLNSMAAQLRSSYLELENLGFHDGLTGALNKRKLEQDLDSELARVERYHTELSVLLLDLDHFKKVNDHHGHLAGDEVLKRVVQAVNDQLRSVDNLYRFGGEEFVVILPQTDRDNAMIVAERIRRSVERLLITTNCNHIINITVSIGIASCPQDGCDGSSIIEHADKGVYQAKQQGRNRVVHA